MSKPNTLSPTAPSILRAAAARNDHHAFPPDHLPAAAKRAVVQLMIKTGLLDEISADDEGPS